MKVKIKELKPNPYRDIDNYPIDQEKIETLKSSIEQTGFWDNLLAREINGIIQIAYGHHRLEALKQVKNQYDEVDIPVKKLTDALMIQIMANENMDEWKTSVKVIDETVRVAKQFLEQNPEEIKTKKPLNLKRMSSPQEGQGYRYSPEAFQIGEFLGWGEKRIYYSLERLGLIKEGVIEKEAIHALPTESSARTFTDYVKKHKIPKEKQRQAVERIKETSRNERAVEDAIIMETYKKPEKKKAEIEKERTKKFDTELATIKNKAEDLISDLQNIKRLINELGQEPFKNSMQSTLLLFSLRDLKNQIDSIINKTDENEK